VADNFWLNNEQWAAIEPHLPMVHSDRSARMIVASLAGLSIVCASTAGGVRFPTDRAKTFWGALKPTGTTAS
jgi:hypothetical protein